MANLQLYESYKREIETGRRKEAAQAIALFIQSFSGLEEKKQWSEAFLNGLENSQKIRHELYEHIVFPVLLESYKRSEPWGIHWLAKTAQNLYQATALWEQVDHKSEYQLLEQLLSITPHDAGVRAELLARQIEWLRYCGHEWPSGILYGHDGATLQECAEIEEAVAKAKDLDLSGTYSAFLADFEGKLGEYISRLEAHESNRTAGRSA